MRARVRTGAATYSAKVPRERKSSRTYPMTSSPTANSVTETPGWTTTPDTSQPGTTGNTVSMIPSRYPSRAFQSTGLTAAARTLTSTESGPTLGSRTSPYSNTSGPPYRL